MSFASLSHAGSNVCKDNNGGCEQLCLFRGGDQRTCACAHGMLAEDNRSCRDYDGYLLYSERTILKSIHLSDETNLNAPIKPFEDPEHMKNVIALSFDYHGGGGKGANRIFFSDIHFGNIQQISDDGSDRKTVVESESPCCEFGVFSWVKYSDGKKVFVFYSTVKAQCGKSGLIYGFNVGKSFIYSQFK